MIDPTLLARAMGLHDGAEITSDRRHLAHHDRVVLVGCLMEMSRPRPSLPDVALAFGTGHTTIIRLWRAWLSWHWRIRHGWLQHAELSLAVAREQKGVAA